MPMSGRVLALASPCALLFTLLYSGSNAAVLELDGPESAILMGRASVVDAEKPGAIRYSSVTQQMWIENSFLLEPSSKLFYEKAITKQVKFDGPGLIDNMLLTQDKAYIACSQNSSLFMLDRNQETGALTPTATVTEPVLEKKQTLHVMNDNQFLVAVSNEKISVFKIEEENLVLQSTFPEAKEPGTGAGAEQGAREGSGAEQEAGEGTGTGEVQEGEGMGTLGRRLAQVQEGEDLPHSDATGGTGEGEKSHDFSVIVDVREFNNIIGSSVSKSGKYLFAFNYNHFFAFRLESDGTLLPIWKVVPSRYPYYTQLHVPGLDPTYAELHPGFFHTELATTSDDDEVLYLFSSVHGTFTYQLKNYTTVHPVPQLHSMTNVRETSKTEATPSKDYCVVFECSPTNTEADGWLNAWANVSGSVIEIAKDKYMTKGETVSACFEKPVDSVQVQNTNTNGWIGSAFYIEHGRKSFFACGEGFKFSTGKDTSPNMLIDGDGTTQSDNYKAHCLGASLCTMYPTSNGDPRTGGPFNKLLFTSLGSSTTHANSWEGWYEKGTSAATWDGKRPEYDELPVSDLRFEDSSGKFVEYDLYDEYAGKTLLEIVQQCSPSVRSNTGTTLWKNGHCTIGSVRRSNGVSGAANLRLFVGDGQSDSKDWTLFAPLAGNGNGDWHSSNLQNWAFGSETKSNPPAGSNTISIYTSYCARPTNWCSQYQDQYYYLSCSGSKTKTHICFDTSGHVGFIDSNLNCVDNWPSAPNTSCPIIFDPQSFQSEEKAKSTFNAGSDVVVSVTSSALELYLLNERDIKLISQVSLPTPVTPVRSVKMSADKRRMYTEHVDKFCLYTVGYEKDVTFLQCMPFEGEAEGDINPANYGVSISPDDKHVYITKGESFVVTSYRK